MRAMLLAAVLVLAVGVMASEAQQGYRFFAMVQWIAGSQLQVITESGAPVSLDLTQADQSSYRGLRAGDPVVIDAAPSTDRRSLVVLEIWRDSGRGYWTQSP